MDSDPYEAVAFSADESRMFVARGTRVEMMDPADGRISGESPGKLEVIIQRGGDHQIVSRHVIGRGRHPLQSHHIFRPHTKPTAPS